MTIKRKKQNFMISMSSMSDLAFLLLIFIMTVALINYRKEVRIDYPQVANSKKVSADNNLEIWIDLGGMVYLNGTPASLEAVEAGVIEAYTKAPDTRVHILADRSSPFENVHQVLNILQVLQYRTVSFVVKDP